MSTSRVVNRYRVINNNPQNFTFNKHNDAYHKLENSITERLEKSYKLDSVFSKDFEARRKKTICKC